MRGAIRWTLYAALAALYLLHNDLWLWSDARLVLGLPAGLLYHVAYCLVTSAVLAMLVGWAWPAFDVDDVGAGLDSAGEGARPSPTDRRDAERASPRPGEPGR